MLAMRGCQRRMKNALMLFLARLWIGNPSVPSNPNCYLAFASALRPTTFAFRGDRTLARGFESKRPSGNRVHKYSNVYGYGYEYEYKCKCSFHSASTLLFLAKPKKAGSVVDNYQTVSVNCNTCRERLFRYKKKNGTKSNLVKCYVERISDDCVGILARAADAEANGNASASASASASADLNAISSENAASSDGNRKHWAPTNDRKRNTKQMQMQMQKQRRHRKHRTQTQKQSQSQTQPSPEQQSAAVPTSLDPDYSWECPKCHTRFARSSLIHGRPALKMIGGKIRMTKK